MAEEREILRYELDAGGVEAGAAKARAAFDSVSKAAAEAAAKATRASEEADQVAFSKWRRSEKAREDAAVAGALDEQIRKSKQGIQELGGAFYDGDRKGEKFVKSVLGGLNPALAQTADFAFDAAEGVTKVGPAMLGLAAGAAVLGSIAALMNSIAAEAKRAEEATLAQVAALAKLRDEGLSNRQTVAQSLQAAGIYGAGEQGALVANRLMDRGVSADLANFGATASVIGGLSDEATMQAIAGKIALGDRAEFGKNAEQNKLVVQRLLQAGASDNAKSALAGSIADTGDLARRQALPETALNVDVTKDTEIARAAKRKGLNDRDVAILRSMLRWRGDEQLEAVYPRDKGDGAFGEGASKDYGTLYGIGQDVARETNLRPRTTAPVTVIQNNVGTQINGAANPFRRVMNPSDYPGGGMGRRDSQ